MTKTLLSPALVASLLFLAGCGGGEKSSGTSAPAAATPSTPAAAAPAAAPVAEENGVKVVHLTGDDTMRYNLTTIEAAPGQKLRIELKNIGKMPKQTMSHNYVQLQPMSDAEINAFGISASMVPPAYLPKDQSKIIAHTDMIGPGETTSVEFTAPSEPGTYPYLCTFPGHFATMRGKLIVK